jgi:hypothetical protein
MFFSKVKRPTRRVGAKELAQVHKRFEALQSITAECAAFGDNLAVRMQAINRDDNAAMDQAITTGRDAQAGLVKAFERCEREVEDAIVMFLGERRRKGEGITQYLTRMSVILTGPIDELILVQRSHGIQLVV